MDAFIYHRNRFVTYTIEGLIILSSLCSLVRQARFIMEADWFMRSLMCNVAERFTVSKLMGKGMYMNRRVGHTSSPRTCITLDKSVYALTYKHRYMTCQWSTSTIMWSIISNVILQMFWSPIWKYSVEYVCNYFFSGKSVIYTWFSYNKTKTLTTLSEFETGLSTNITMK